MSTQNQPSQPNQPTTDQVLQQMLAQMQQLQAQTPLPQPVIGGGGGWGAMKPAIPTPLGVLVPISIENNGQSCGLYLQYGPEYATPEAITGLVGALIANGVPVKTWTPKGSGWGKK